MELEGLGPAVAAAYGLGSGAQISGPVARGQMGSVWSLTTDRGRYAVKVPFAAPTAAEAEDDAAYQDAVASTGVPMPAVRRTRESGVLADVGSTTVRVYDWVDLAGHVDRGLDPAAVGAVIAAIHRVDHPDDRPVIGWHTDPVGEDEWRSLVSRCRSAGAPFAPALEAMLPEILALEQLLVPPTTTRRCHCDLWADNVRGTADGGVVVLDWENSGSADPAGELPMVMFDFGLEDPARMRSLYRAYVDAGGPEHLTDEGDCSMLVATLHHIGHEGATRWLAATTQPQREANAAWVAEFVGTPLTRKTVDLIVAAAR